ncbi:unnamed protein product [Pleuronectes platessa]|uniref:tRNA wybutosine-synthesizing protein 4 n=1 Tax=Pleuronectes platessa TaxID=8262 RepID=A0A9N7TYS6_PLEPL|nr:unnamed protein product [Pleuronectes platessa]
MLTSSRQKKKKGGDVAVQGTNDSSVVSKVSAAARGFFHDDFLQLFVCKEARRSPLINRGYYVRWRAVDHCVRRFLHVTENCPKRQVSSENSVAGRGFDSLYFRLRADEALSGVVVFEVDFPDVARRKTALISSNITLRGMLDPRLPAPTGAVHVCSGQYRLLGLDVREESRVKEALEAAGLDWAAPTLILSEVVLTYMETQWSDVVISWAAKLLPQSLFVMYEQIRPHDPFGSIMQDHFHKLNSRLHALRQYPDAAAQRRRFLDKGWDQCVCLDMNDFYLGLVPEDERRRVEVLEPFDEYEEWHQKCSHYFILTASRGSGMTQALLTHPPVSPVSSVNPSLSPVALSVKPDPACVEGLGMASTSVSPGRLLLTGGSSRGGRGAVSRVLLRGPEGWRSVTVEPSLDLGVRLYHTVTSCPGGGAVVYGGRSSPLSPARGLFKVVLDPAGPPAPLDGVKLCVEEMLCTGDPPPPRWRHTAAIVSHKGKDFLFVYGGKNESEAVLGDAHFLCLDQQHWTEIPVEGAGTRATPLPLRMFISGRCGDVRGSGPEGGSSGGHVVLRPSDRGFSWERLELQPPPVPRYSHSAHVIGQKLVVVGGVWMHSDGVPGVVMIDLATRSSVEFSLDTSRVPWPLMLHSFCCELTDSEEPELLLIGGGGNCFSFGTHFNPRPVSVNLRPVLG